MICMNQDSLSLLCIKKLCRCLSIRIWCSDQWELITKSWEEASPTEIKALLPFFQRLPTLLSFRSKYWTWMQSKDKESKKGDSKRQDRQEFFTASRTKTLMNSCRETDKVQNATPTWPLSWPSSSWLWSFTRNRPSGNCFPTTLICLSGSLPTSGYILLNPSSTLYDFRNKHKKIKRSLT